MKMVNWRLILIIDKGDNMKNQPHIALEITSKSVRIAVGNEVNGKMMPVKRKKLLDVVKELD